MPTKYLLDPPRTANLERLWEVYASLPADKRDEFVHTFLGSLSIHVDPVQWEDSLRVAKDGVLARG
jgi:hypothetical protein